VPLAGLKEMPTKHQQGVHHLEHRPAGRRGGIKALLMLVRHTYIVAGLPGFYLSTFGQGCSTLFVVVHIAQGFEASEGRGVAILDDGVGLIEPQDIISEAAQSGEDARVAADARGVFAESTPLRGRPPMHATG
jgi:hypothetical protein